MKIHVPDNAIPIIHEMNTQNKGFNYQFIHADVKCKLYLCIIIVIHVYSLILGSVQTILPSYMIL